jgi:CheY-like chemotaxis protein
MVSVNGYSVLLVEDDSNDVLFIQRAFSRVNPAITIHVVKDGDAAVDYLNGSGDYGDRDRYPLPSLILLDLKLPRRSGIEVLQWIRQKDSIKRIPVVVLTSSRERLDVDLSYDVGVNSYLVKPVSFDDLSIMIKALNTYWLSLNEYPTIMVAS